ncbi:MAG: MFS transporter [Thermoguttaceae bacterium]|jgi:MFS family permease
MKPDPYAAWRIHNFRLYSISWFLLVFAKQVETVAVGIHVYYRTLDPLSLAWVGLVQALPIIILAIAGGQLADRFNRRYVILCTYSLSVVSAAGLSVVAFLNGPVWWMYIFLGLGSIGYALGGASRSSILPQIVGAEIFSNAITWNTTIFHIAAMTGPAAGGLIIGWEKTAVAAFVFVMFLRIFSLVGVAFIRNRPQSEPMETMSLESVLAGIRFVWKTKLILATITLDLFAVLLGGFTYLLPVFVRDILQVSESWVGYLRAAEAVGAVFVALVIAHAPPMKRAGATMLWAVTGFGAATIVFGFSKWYLLSMLMMFLIGALDNISVVVRHTLVQMLTPDSMRGRVSAVNNIFIVASNDIGGVESSVTTWLFHSAVISVVFGGIGTILVVIASALIWPQILTIGSLQDVHPASEPLPIADEEKEIL